MDERKALRKAMPKSIQEIWFDFDWDNSKVWEIEAEETQIEVEALLWLLELPLWKDIDTNAWWKVVPKEVIQSPEAYSYHHERILESDLTRPISLMENKGRLMVLDGIHRLAKAKMLNIPTIKGKIIPRRHINKIAV